VGFNAISTLLVKDKTVAEAASLKAGGGQKEN